MHTIRGHCEVASVSVNSIMDSYRCQLEVVKWTHAVDILQSCCIVSSAWHRCCDSDELWYSLLDDYSLEAGDSVLRPKELFRMFNWKLVLLSPTSLRLYNYEADRWQETTLTEKVVVDKSSAWTFDGKGSVLCCGGGAGYDNSSDMSDTYDNASLVSMRGKVTALPAMQVARKWHGIYMHQGTCYVFGGVGTEGSDVASCEKLQSTASQAWSPLPPMYNSRSSFNPCLHEGRLYLMAGKTMCCEVFTLQSETFERLSVQLENEHSTAVVLEGKVAVFTSTNYYSGPDLEHLDVKQWGYCYIWGNMNPVVRKNVLYVPQSYNSFSILTINLDTLKYHMKSVPTEPKYES